MPGFALHIRKFEEQITIKAYAESTVFSYSRSIAQRTEFLGRYYSHILPPGFIRIGHYGFLASGNKRKELSLARKDLNQP